MKKWTCTVCGYLHKGGDPPEKCPVCSADRSLFEAKADGESEAAASSAPDAPKPEADPDTKWLCTVCGYIHTGPEPPEKCPVCGADASLFIIQEEKASPEPDAPAGGEPAEDAEPAPAEAAAEKQEAPAADIPSSGGGFFTWLTDQMVRHHLHPIAVHVPNGVLPVTVLFILGAVFLQFGELAIASFYNLAITVLIMPVVVFSGIIEWKKRYGGHLTSMFIIKMCAAATVFISALCLTIWMAIDPDVLESSRRWIFAIASLVMMGAAAIAGLLGGKLVYKD